MNEIDVVVVRAQLVEKVEEEEDDGLLGGRRRCGGVEATKGK